MEKVFWIMIVLLPLHAFGQEVWSPLQLSAAYGGNKRKTTGDKISSICLYSVHNGQGHRVCIRKADLMKGNRFVVEGHVSGIIAFCEEDMEVRVDNRALNRIRKNRDGSFSAKYFGKIDLTEIPDSLPDNTYFDQPGMPQREYLSGKSFLTGGYSLFPKVAGNLIFAGDVLPLRFESEGDVFEIAIEQKGYQQVPLSAAPAEEETYFRYLGTRLNRLRDDIPDFDERIAAITRSIRQIEDVTGTRLVSLVNILDYEPVRNALSCEESSEIWFYIQTFRNETLEELETIAAHEALHKYVDFRRLIKSHEVRELFADLKQYSLFSRERFLIITRGIIPPDTLFSAFEKNPFFAFINERNFLADRKGGHAHENLDEFCTSFIHSLLHIHRLEQNLAGSIRLSGGRSYDLSPDEQRELLENYLRTYRTILKVIYKQEQASGTVSADYQFFESRFRAIENYETEYALNF